MSTSTKTLKVFECDHDGCTKTAIAGSAEYLGEWRKRCQERVPEGFASRLTWHYCGEHSADADEGLTNGYRFDPDLPGLKR